MNGEIFLAACAYYMVDLDCIEAFKKNTKGIYNCKNLFNKVV
jgi:hypothetical protein